jgi:hypothetical protein
MKDNGGKGRDGRERGKGRGKMRRKREGQAS